MNQQDYLKSIIKQSLSNLYQITDIEINTEIPKDSNNGDFSSNIAFKLTKLVGKNPLIIAQELASNIQDQKIEKIEAVKPGFLNFYLKKTSLAEVIEKILREQEMFGSNEALKNEKLLIEFVSANPTGKLHIGHARGAAWGDALVRLFRFCGGEVLAEYYINDAGNQIDNLALSLLARYRQLFGLDFNLPDDGYHGQDIIEIAEKLKEKYGDSLLQQDPKKVLEFLKDEGTKLQLERIDEDLKYFKVYMDSWISEKKLYQDGKVEQVVKMMESKNLLFEQDGALWFKSTNYGDDKDRVMKKANGFYTYLTPDIANHLDKIKRGYNNIIDLWGADHHSYITRLKAALTALGYPNCLEVDLIQMVRLIEDGREVKMSKRSGNAITLRELCEDIGVDMVRYFIISKMVNSHFDFDLSLAKDKTVANPLYYIQYACARINSVLKKNNLELEETKFDLLGSEKETEIMKHLSIYPDVVVDAAKTRMPNKICNYAYKLAQLFHSYYNDSKFIDVDNFALSNQRLQFIIAISYTFESCLNLLGIDIWREM